MWWTKSVTGPAALKPEPLTTRHYAALNNKRLPRVRVIVPPSATQAYLDLQSFVLPRYDLFYLVRRKRAFNTVAFRQAYDVIVCDRHFRIVAIHANQAPGYISDYYPQAHFIFFTAAHTANFYDLRLNDRLQLVRHWFVRD